MSVSAKEIKRRLTAFTEACRVHGMKLTHQRLEIFKAVAGSDEHPNAETVFENVRNRLPTISLDTVYRTLATLEKLGVISRVNVLPEPARFDANMEAHHHFLCTECGAIKDFSSSELDNFRIPEEVQSWGKVKSVRVELRSICKECLKLRNATANRNLDALDDNLKKFGKIRNKGRLTSLKTRLNSAGALWPRSSNNYYIVSVLAISGQTVCVKPSPYQVGQTAGCLFSARLKNKLIRSSW